MNCDAPVKKQTSISCAGDELAPSDFFFMAKQTDKDRSVIDSLYRISRVVSETEDTHVALKVILQELVERLNASSASVSLINPDTNELEMEMYHGMPSQRFAFRLGMGVTGWVALHGKPLLVPDVRLENRYITLKSSIRSEMAAPMLLKGTTVGVVNVDSEAVNAFTEEDLKLLCLLTSEATTAVSRLWLINQLKAKADQLQALIRVGEQLVGKRDLQSILFSISEEARKLMDCRLCAIFLLEEPPEAEPVLRLQALSGLKGNRPYQETLGLDESSVGFALSRQKQVAVQELAKTEEVHFRELIASEGLKSMLSTPIIYEGRSIGVLNAYTDHIHRFNNDERLIYTSLASLGAVAIRNSQLYARVFSSEELLRKSEKLTTLGLLAAEIAHEIRNPLTVIKLLFDTLTWDFDAADPRTRDVSMIREKVLQLDEIVGRVLEFGKSRTDRHAHEDLNQLAEETVLLVRLKAEQTSVQIDFKPFAEPLVADVHKGQIQQVLLNLLLNALAAMPGGGTIRLEIDRQEASGSTPAQAVVTVSDTGGGLSPKLQQQLFQPFLSGSKEGTGLGLAISRQIIKSHRGSMELLHSDENGSAFVFRLPL